MHQQGYVPDVSLGAGDAPEGRPWPYMIFRIMEKLHIKSVSAVLKVGDTVHDIEEGLNAGVWSVGVTRSSSEVGCSEAEFAALSPKKLRRGWTAPPHVAEHQRRRRSSTRWPMCRRC